MYALNTEGRAKPLVSVVIPTHNRADLLSRAVNSVLGQTYERLEIIIVDDASTDNTREIVHGFKGDRIRYLRHDNNRGGSATRNTGIDAATGQYIAFLDDDDEWVPQMIQKQLDSLQGFDAVLCTCFVNGKSMAKRQPKSVVALEDLKRNPYAVGGTGVLMVNAPIIKELRFDEQLPIQQDWDLFIRIAQRCDIAYLNEPLLIYNQGQHDRITNRRANLTLEQLEPYLRMLEKHRSFFGPSLYNRHIAGMLLYGFFRHRSEKAKHLLYTVRRCGIIAVARVLVRRAYKVATSYV
jgi:glycosyltransferase involved in cell wall biosynthesis